MARNSKYQELVAPRFEEIKTWYRTLNEEQIAKKLGIDKRTLRRYKAQYPELAECFRQSKTELAEELRDTLKKKAQGFFYTETRRTYLTDAHGNKISDVKVEETQKYSPPDTGAIHLLLKNLDDNWRNDDKATMDLKKEKIEIDKQKMEDNW